ncbi:MAG TPA: hypothetical protein VGF14_05720 [Alphaproteobacteria bacterium]
MTSSYGHAMAFGSGKRMRSPGEYQAQLAYRPLRFESSYLMHAKDVRHHYDATRYVCKPGGTDLFAPIDVCVPEKNLVACTMISLDHPVGSEAVMASIQRLRENDIQATFFHHFTFDKNPDGKFNEKGRQTNFMIGVPALRPVMMVDNELFKDMHRLVGDIHYNNVVNYQNIGWSMNGYRKFYEPDDDFPYEEFLPLQKEYIAQKRKRREEKIQQQREKLSDYFEAGILNQKDGRMILDKDDPSNSKERKIFVEFALSEGWITKNDLPLSDQNKFKLHY